MCVYPNSNRLPIMVVLCSSSSSKLVPLTPPLDLLKKSRTTRDVNQIHARAITTGIIKCPSLTTKIILTFSSSPHPPLVEFARSIFFFSQQQSYYKDNPFLWNLIIKSFSHGRDDPEHAVYVFSLMLEHGFFFVDKFSFSLVLKACSRVGLMEEGFQIHGLLLKCEFGLDVFLQNSLINVYLRCGYLEFARLVFDRMTERDSVTWNLMIDGYVKQGMMNKANDIFERMPEEDKNLITWNSMISGYAKLEHGFKFAWGLFQEMPEKDLISWNSMINACVKCGKLQEARELFDQMPRKDVVSWASMVDGYAKMGSVDSARQLFDEIPDSERDLVTWNAMLSGYVLNGHSAEALKLFHSMWTESSSLIPDETTLVVALSAISDLGSVSEGTLVHDYIERNGFDLNGKLGVALIDMYSKCGSINNAMWVFGNLKRKSVEHWNAMIGGLAVHGFGELALEIFMEMVSLSFKPDDITFIGVLNACGHAGMVKEGLICFDLMRRVHGINPKLQHYGCMVDLLGRAGHLDEAKNLIETMPIEPNDVVWRALLSASMHHNNFEMGIWAAYNLIHHGSSESNSYVLLSNLYAWFGMWSEVSKVRVLMKERDMKKVPGCSWIEIESTVHEFVVGDKSHPQVKEIYSVLDQLFTSLS